MAVQTPAGELFGYQAPATGNTVEIPIVLTDAAGARVTGVTFDAAGMAVTYRKEGQHSYSAFPTFDTNNWAECGNGEYVIIIRQSDAGELALMDTPGTLTFFVTCTATNGDFAKIKVNAADVERVGATAAALTAYDVATAAEVAAVGGGAGAFERTVTVATSAGVTFEGVKVALAGPNSQQYVQYTDTSGIATFHVSAGAWIATVPANGAQAGGHTDFNVSAAGDTVVTVVAANIPAPTDPDNYLIYGYELDENDVPIAGMTVKIVAIDTSGRTDVTATAQRSTKRKPVVSDAAGLWSFEVAKALDGTQVQLHKAWTDAAGAAKTETWYATIDATKADGDLLPWAALSPKLTT